MQIRLSAALNHWWTFFIKSHSIQLALIAVIGLGAVIRFGIVYDLSFPINDGGFFYVNVLDLIQNQFVLPYISSYNNLEIPFAYPPLSFYILGLIHVVLDIPLFTLFSVYPVLINLLAIPLVYWLGSLLLKNNHAALLSALAFALLPRSMTWLISGGGVTRGTGFLFALISIAFFVQMLEHRRIHWAIGAGIAGGLAVLSHTEWGWVTVFSCIVILLVEHVRTLSFWKVRQLAVLVVTFLIICLPWLITILQRYGIFPVISAFTSGRERFDPLRIILYLNYNFTDEPMLGLLAVLGLLGLISALFKGRVLFIIWFAAHLILNQRGAATTMIIPFVFSIAIFFLDVIKPALINPTDANEADQVHPLMRLMRKIILFGFPIFVIVYGAWGAYQAPYSVNSPLHYVSVKERLAMEWVRDNTPPDSRFIVLTGSSIWAVDEQSEWFPALTKRTSLGTVQATEWITDYPFNQRIRDYSDLQNCLRSGLQCIQNWAKQRDLEFDFIYLSPEANGSLVEWLFIQPDYELVYFDEVSIFQHV